LCVDEAAEAVVDAYRNYELVERGLAELTVVNACYLVRQFLAWRAATGRPALEQLDAGELCEYVSHRAGRLRIGAVRQSVGVLRTLCRFLFATGVTPLDLSGAVPSVSGIRFDGLPKALDRDVVEALLASCALDRPTGRRDYAILVLMLRLGLRAVEVARMELGDIDWRAGEIEIRGKGGRRDRLPLVDDVGRALADYLVDGRRPSSSRSVFPCRPPARRSECPETRSCSSRAPPLAGRRSRWSAGTGCGTRPALSCCAAVRACARSARSCARAIR
jgi:integrase/recombinase XerD